MAYTAGKADIQHPQSGLPQVDIDTVEKFEALRQTEKDYFTDMVKRCKDSGATLIICQWGFDDEANHLLMANDLPCEPELCMLQHCSSHFPIPLTQVTSGAV